MTSLMAHQIGNFIDGRFLEPKRTKVFEFLNPTTNEVLGAIPEGSSDDVDRAVNAALRAFKTGGWNQTTAEGRGELLLKVASGLEKHIEELARTEALNAGIPITQTRSQVHRAAENFRFFAEMATKVLETAFPTKEGFLNYTTHKPVGVAGLITPWNTPLMLETWKIAPCLAAGNTCVLKPSEWTPMSANQLATIIQDAGIPDGVFNVVHGIGEISGAALVAHPAVRLISFTGETTTGKEIARNGASTLKRYSMELRGKNPAIVFEDADLERARDAVIFMAYSLNGERCTSNSRLLVQHSIYDEFIGQTADRAKRIRIGDPLDERSEIGPLVRPEHWLRVKGYIDLGVREGARIAAGGGRPSALKDGNYLEPTLLIDVEKSMRVAKEEIFGPVLGAMSFENEAEAIDISNDVIYGLAAYVWTSDWERASRISDAVESGTVWVNSHNVRDLRAPFGGSKASGIGREGGLYSFDFYTEAKTVQIALGKHHIPTFGGGDDNTSRKSTKRGKVASGRSDR
jgi:5-carboxymethyl-2-hydroxymuconic-semialdehyde dehydrogenase